MNVGRRMRQEHRIAEVISARVQRATGKRVCTLSLLWAAGTEVARCIIEATQPLAYTCEMVFAREMGEGRGDVQDAACEDCAHAYAFTLAHL